MRLALPSAKQLTVMVKYGLLLALPILIMSWWVVKQDPNLPRVEQYLSKNPAIVNKVGSIESLNLANVTYVQDAIDFDGKKTSGYSLYRYSIIGSSGKLLVTVRADKSSPDQLDRFSIDDVNL
jgi:hypothetical protein